MGARINRLVSIRIVMLLVLFGIGGGSPGHPNSSKVLVWYFLFARVSTTWLSIPRGTGYCILLLTCTTNTLLQILTIPPAVI